MLASTLLTACSGMRIVDSQVAAFSKLDAAPVAASWKFDRLPSQESLSDAASIRQTKLETMAAQELAKFGFKPQAENASAPAKYRVQLSARIQRLERGPFDEPGYGYGGHPFGTPHGFGHGIAGRDYVVTATGRVIYLPTFQNMPQPWYVREISLIIRDTNGGSVVYETKAQHAGRWADSEAVLPAMLAAALQGFPKPPEGKRMVNIEIPR